VIRRRRYVKGTKIRRISGSRRIYRRSSRRVVRRRRIVRRTSRRHVIKRRVVVKRTVSMKTGHRIRMRGGRRSSTGIRHSIKIQSAGF
jgi:hypothetical protein